MNIDKMSSFSDLNSVITLSDSEEPDSVINLDCSSDEERHSEIEIITIDESEKSGCNSSNSLIFCGNITPDFIPISVPVKKQQNFFIEKKKGTSVTLRKPKRKNIFALKKQSKKHIVSVSPKKRKKKSKIAASLLNKKNFVSDVVSKNLSAKIQKYPLIKLNYSNILNTGKQLKEGLRPVTIDGSNVAFGFGNGEFSIQGVIIVIQYFKERGHDEIVCFLPAHFKNISKSTEQEEIISRFEKDNIIVYTPSRRLLHGKNIRPYDDRFVVQYANEREGVIISNDGYRDLVLEEPEWRKTIEERVINYTFARGIFMLPKDPLGPNGPTLDEILRFPSDES